MSGPRVGDPAPPFELPDQEGTLISLADLTGAPLVLYFYPGDFTPGCTREACSFRDAFDELSALDARIVGISSDPPGEHQRFRNEHDLPFTLLSDVDGRVADAYGADGFLGTRRITFILDADGIIQERIRSPLPGSHVKNALSTLKETPRA